MISAEERQRRSERAKRMHAEGRLGSRSVAKRAAAKSAEIRQARSSAAIAQALYETHREDVEKALLHALRHGTVSERIKAAEVMTRAGLAGQRQETAEVENEHRQMSREELLAALSQKLTGPSPAAAMLRRQIEGAEVIDAEVIEH